MKALTEMKATLLDDDAFRLLALPYGGPIPYPGAPRGADLDRQWLSERTDFGEPPSEVNVTWHHGADPWRRADAKDVVGKAVDLEWEDDGGWVKVWMDAGRRRTRLIKALAEAANEDDEVNIYGSSEAVPGSGRMRAGQREVPWTRRRPGEITRWHYAGQTLSTSPQNTNSILVPVKATLEDFASSELVPTPDYFDDLARFLDNLRADPTPTLPQGGDGEAKAGRVLASRNEARLREAVDEIESVGWSPVRRAQALDKVRQVLAELEQAIA